MLLRLLFVFLLLFFGSVEILYAGVCYTRNLQTLNEVLQAQECLKREIQKSIDIARRYEEYNEDVLNELNNYSMLRAKCKKYDLLLSHRYSYDWERQRDRSCYLAAMSKAELRKVERRSGVLDALYSDFLDQINQLRDELELIWMEYQYNIKGR